jgi:uncharacterized membrane protein YgcG
MNKIVPVILFIALSVLSLPGAKAQKVKAYQSKWNPGLEKEHGESLINQMQLDAKSQFLFLISNDEKNLYIDLVVADRAALQKIMRYGLTTWFNPEGKQKKVLGIEFPVTAEGKEVGPNYKHDKDADRKEMRMAMMASKNAEMTLIGFGEKNEVLVIDPKKDPSFDGNVEMMEGGRLWISLAISLEKLQRPDLASFTNPISLGFETGYMDVTGQGSPSGGGSSSQGGMPGGGGMYGGQPGGGGYPGGGAQGTMGSSSAPPERPDISKLATPSKLWIKQVTLSAKP